MAHFFVISVRGKNNCSFEQRKSELLFICASHPQGFTLTYCRVIEGLIDFKWQVKPYVSCVTH